MRDDLRDVVARELGGGMTGAALAGGVLDAIVAEAQRRGFTHLSIPDLTGVVAEEAGGAPLAAYDHRGTVTRIEPVYLRPLPDKEEGASDE